MTLPPNRGRSMERRSRVCKGFEGKQAFEKRDVRRWALSFVMAAYWLYASFLRIHTPCISSFCTGLHRIGFTNGLLSSSESASVHWLIPGKRQGDLS